MEKHQQILQVADVKQVIFNPLYVKFIIKTIEQSLCSVLFTLT